jgi:outer membrane protein OmpA-like peptidoglycan-associated protein
MFILPVLAALAAAPAAPGFGQMPPLPTPEEIAHSLMRGAHPVRPPGMPAPAADAVRPSWSYTVYFATGSAAITPQGAAILDRLAAALRMDGLRTDRFRIEGHTDTTGSDTLNQALSDQRAAAAVDYLVQHQQIDRARLEPKGMGKKGLAVWTPDQTPNPANRRVLVVNITQ